MTKRIIAPLILLLIFSDLYLQGSDENIDSLWNLYLHAEHDTTQIQLLLDIGNNYKSNNPDSAFYYYNKALELSKQSESADYPDALLSYKAQSIWGIGYIQRNHGDYDMAKENFSEALEIYSTLGDKEGAENCYRNIGIILKNQGFYDEAMENYLKALKISEDLGDKNRIAACNSNIGHIYKDLGDTGKAMESFLKALRMFEETGEKKRVAACYNNIGNVYDDRGNYDKAMENYLASLKIREEIGDKKGMYSCYNNIGIVQINQDNIKMAIEDFSKALHIAQELGDRRGESMCLSNIGYIYLNQGKNDIALENFVKACQIDEEMNYKRGMSICYLNIGSVYENNGNYNIAINNYLKALKIDKQIGNSYGVISIYTSISYLYIELADSCKSPGSEVWKGHFDLALDYARKAFDLAVEIDALPKQNEVASCLNEAYTKLGNFKQALHYAEIYIDTRDSMFSEEKTKALAEMTTKYEAEKKQLQIEKMEQQKELDDKTIEAQQAKNRKQQIMIFSAVGGFLIVLVFSIIILRMFRQKRKANILLAAQNDEINEQKDKIEEQNQNITDSIVYAQRIQRALLPPGDYMKQLLPHRFIFYKPRDIVSGDFYWIRKKDGLIVTAAADCTGHGVPGAMMSMLGVSILNEIVNTMKKPDAAEILNSFRSKLIASLHQGGKDTHVYDGIDLAFCIIDLKSSHAQFSGANCPLYLIRGGKLKEIKGDKMPIGVHARMDNFTNHDIKLQPEDMLYIFSDGFIDQFGGEFDKRFTQRRFKELLLEIHNQSMTDQKENLEKVLNGWQGKSEQIDDILVMGVRI